MKRSAVVYVRSPKPYPRRLPEPEYSTDFELRRVRPQGQIKWRGDLLFISEALAGKTIGIRESDDDGFWQLRFGPVHLGLIDLLGSRLEADPDSLAT